jgi:hypothetical protein
MMSAQILVKELCAQRNAAMDAVVNCRVQLEVATANCDSAYKILKDLIRSGAISDHQVQDILSNQDFADWYKSNP